MNVLPQEYKPAYPVKNLILHPQNPNRGRVDVIGESIETNGFYGAVLCQKSTRFVLRGNHTLKAAVEKGAKTIPTFIVDCDDETALKILLVDNQSARKATMDDEILLQHLHALIADAAGNIDALLGTGYTDEDLQQLEDAALQKTEGIAGDDPSGIIDSAGALKEQWGVESGQVWIIGKHRLVCGDSTDPQSVAACLNGAKPLLMVTDPPYGVNYDPAWRREAGVNNNTEKLGQVQNDDNADWTASWRNFPGDVVYVWHAGVNSDVVKHSIEASGFDIRSQIIWGKDRFALGRGDYHWQHEPCWYGVRTGQTSHRTDDRSQSTLWTIPAREDDGHGHGTQKPVECMARPIRNHICREVYDPFLGSGTTMVAAEQLGRTCYAVEIEPKYVAVALERMRQTCGIVGELE